MKTSKKWRKPLFRQPERRQGILPALFGARIGALLPSSSQWPLCATAKTASYHSPAQAKRRKITWMPLGPTPDAAPAIGGAEAVNGTKGGRKAPAARGGRRARKARTKGGRGPFGPRPPFGLAGPGAKGPRAAKRRRPPGPLELLPPPKGRKKPGPTLYGAGRTKRCQKGARQRFRPQGKARAHGLRARAVETARRGLLAPGRPQPLLRAYQPARSTAARAGPTCA